MVFQIWCNCIWFRHRRWEVKIENKWPIIPDADSLAKGIYMDIVYVLGYMWPLCFHNMGNYSCCNSVIGWSTVAESFKSCIDSRFGLIPAFTAHISIYLWCQKPDWFCYVNNLWFQRLLLQLYKVNTSAQFRSYKKKRARVRVSPTAAADREPGITPANQT